VAPALPQGRHIRHGRRTFALTQMRSVTDQRTHPGKKLAALVRTSDFIAERIFIADQNRRLVLYGHAGNLCPARKVGLGAAAVRSRAASRSLRLGKLCRIITFTPLFPFPSIAKLGRLREGRRHLVPMIFREANAPK